MKLDRLLGITMELLTKKRVTATTLAARYEVSVRTIYRDVDLINQAGIPVASYPGADGGFELMSGFYLTRQHFSVDDFLTIYNLLKGIEGTVKGRYTTILNKLGTLQPALLNGGCHEQILFDMSTSEHERTWVQPILNAIERSNLMTLHYTSTSGSCSERQVEPLQLYWEQGVWYLEAYCLLKQAKRIFRVSRISTLEVSTDRFLPRGNLAREDQEAVQGIQAHLRFDSSAGPRVIEQFPEAFISGEGHLDVQTVFYTKAYAISVILSYGSKVEIISPPELKEDLLQELEEIRKRYE